VSEPGRRFGVLGGTFDPVHLGHLVAASEAGHALGLDEVIFVPTGQPWQKLGRELAPAEDRYAMTMLATASNPLFSVSRVDIDRPGQTYTVDTLRDLRAERGPGAEFFFIMGADALSGLGTWHDPQQLLALAKFVGCTRAGHQMSAKMAADERFVRVEIPALEISSTMCRERVAAGLPITYLVPEPVAQYIAKRRLYLAGHA
jgi:nicotinate-nucleotide adenylyltransferase